MPRSRKKTQTKKKRAPSSRASWSEGERRVDREAAKAGVKPIRDLVPHLTPEDGDDLLSAIHEMRDRERQVYITQGERRAQERCQQSLQRALLTLLEVRFGAVSEELAVKVRQVPDTATLDALVQRAAIVTAPDELF